MSYSSLQVCNTMQAPFMQKPLHVEKNGIVSATFSSLKCLYVVYSFQRPSLEGYTWLEFNAGISQLFQRGQK